MLIELAKTLLGRAPANSWQKVLRGGGPKELARFFEARKRLGLAGQLTQEEWQELGNIGLEAAHMASANRSFLQLPIQPEIWRYKIVVETCHDGLELNDEAKRWWAWMTLWRIDAGLAYGELLPTEFGKVTDIYGIPLLPAGPLVLRKASVVAGRTVELKAAPGENFKSLLGSSRTADKELAARLGALVA